jgi:hypothetical protein
MDFQKIIDSSEYDFLRTNDHLGKNIMFLTLGGSYAYGTNIETSDVDIRGVANNKKQDLLGLSGFEQVINNETDTTVYSFNKLISLILNCNPNTIELLGSKPEHYFQMTKSGQELLDNKNLFLSKRALHSFGGYANQQLRRLQNALARDNYPQTEKENHILNSIRCHMETFNQTYTSFPEGSYHLYIDKTDREDLDTEIFVDVNMKHYPLRDYKNIWSEMHGIVKEYGNLNKRNKKKDDLHLNKHAMHLVRLYLMCFDILEKEEINTYREYDLEFLLSIRNGKFQKEDGSYYDEFYELIDGYEKRLEYAKENSSLPESPDYKKVEELVISINERAIND